MKTKGSLLRRILTILIVIAVIAILCVTFIMRGKITLYSNETTTGNTSCNLLNGGLFCEVDDTIFFANPSDQNKLYRMDRNMENIKKVNDDRISYMNGAGKYLFYTRRNDKLKNDGNALLSLSTTGLYRLNISTTSASKLYEEPTQVACLYGNFVYYQHYDQKEGLKLYAAKIDGSSDTELLNEAAAPYAVSDNQIYYTGWDRDHNIHSMNIDGSNQRVIYDGNCTNLTKQGDYLYFMDMSANYALCRIATDGGAPEILINQQIATYNISDDGKNIFYQLDNGTDDNGLYSLDLSAKSSELIASGNYNYLHLTSDYLFYEDFEGTEAYVMELSSGKTKPFTPSTAKKKK